MSWQFHDRDDDDAPQAIDLEAEGDEYDLVECPGCRREVIEGVPRCPHCGQWLFGDTPAARRARGWFWPLMIALLVAVILVIWHGLGR